MDIENIAPVIRTPVPETMILLDTFDTASTRLVGYLDEGCWIEIPEVLKQEILEESERINSLVERLNNHYTLWESYSKKIKINKKI